MLIRYEDEVRSLLRKCLESLSDETLTEIISNLYDDFHNTDLDVSDRLEAHMQLVGIMSIMLHNPDELD